jgi:hypothetical protein
MCQSGAAQNLPAMRRMAELVVVGASPYGAAGRGHIGRNPEARSGTSLSGAIRARGMESRGANKTDAPRTTRHLTGLFPASSRASPRYRRSARSGRVADA